jgi:hypothetical protein
MNVVHQAEVAIDAHGASDHAASGAVDPLLLKRRAKVVLAGATLLTLTWVGILIWAAGKLLDEFVG